MTDKIQLIKEWVENLKKQSHTIPNFGINALAGFQLACDDVVAFINSLPEESTDEANCTTKSEDLEEEIDKIWRTCNPIDEGMGVETANIHIEQFDDIARHFAEWQKDKMNLLLQTEYEKGLFDMNEAMMKDAVELHIIESFNPVGTENEKPHGFTALCYNAKYPDFYTVTGQTIKVVPIKEIQQNEQDCRKKGIGSISKR